MRAGATQPMRAPAGLARPVVRRASGRSWEPIYAVVRKIPRGRVATYGQIAALAGFPARRAWRATRSMPYPKARRSRGTAWWVRAGGLRSDA